ncbi:RND transporter [Pedobacter ginsenosidimutans]|uniref:RND transporter n=1 Tax=Pedobacter ginsenosidimutans TaxID=687842 RepID=A0A0T5VUE2_9SPHI|nr:efflux transporter outer membrane subunit [Pedobacter ginsenosidimutans]KRT17495.1 RND transporter [Pedobacter ginsenosidimutans]
MKLAKINIYLLLGTGLYLSSCAVGRKYSRPEIEIPVVYRQQISITGDTVLLPWKTFFQDPKLVELINQALVKNMDVSVAMLNLEQVNLSYKQAKLGLIPSLDLAIGASRNFPSKNSLNGSLNQQFTGERYLDDFNASLSLSWEADIWGKVKMQKAGARANYLMQKENLAALRTRIVAQVAQSYNNLITLDEQLKVAERNTALSDSTLKMIRIQFKSAQVNSLAVDQAEAQKKTAELLVPLTKQNIAVQENALSILCGKFPDQIERASGRADLIRTGLFQTGVPARLLARRPDIKAAEYAVMAANSNTGLAKAAMFPAFSLTPSVGMNSFKFNNWFDLPGSLARNFAGNIAQPIFRKKELRTAYEIAQLEQQKSAEQFRLSVMTAVGEVSDALVKSKYAQERSLLVDEKRAALEKAGRDAMLLFRSGMATYLEVIVAQNNSLQNELERTEIKRDQFNAIIDLYRSLGGGVE